MKHPIYFGGAAGAAQQTSEQPYSLSDKYVPLSSMDGAEIRQAFGWWLGIVYVNRGESYQRPIDWGIPAEEDPILVMDFRNSYEAGDWKKLDRGLNVDELCLSSELTLGAKLMCIYHPDIDDGTLDRVERKRGFDAGDMAAFASDYFAFKAGAPRHGVITLVHDGQNGHCIVLLDADPKGALFAYHDPWPGRSILCAGENIAGVDAVSLGRRPMRRGGPEVNLWQITRQELESVVVSMVFLASDWEALTGETL